MLVPTTRPTRTRAAGAALVVLATVGLAGCAPGVAVQPAPFAADPVCASIVLALPDELGDGLEQLDTTAQATTAWGTAQAPVVLRCGVEPPAPTTDRCVTVSGVGGASVDWLVVPDDPDAESTSWTLTTYGRVPAVEVSIPATVAAERSTSFVDRLGPAVAQVEPTRACL